MSNNRIFPNDRHLLRGVSRSFYLTLRALPYGLREPLGHAYLLARLSDTVADSSSANPQSRLGWLDALAKAICGNVSASGNDLNGLAALSDGITNPAERELLARAGVLVRGLDAFPLEILTPMRKMLSTIIDGQAGDIRRFELDWEADADGVIALPDACALDSYTYQVAGCVGEFWTILCAARYPGFARRPIEEMTQDGIRYGKGLQLINILRDLPDDLARGRCYLPKDELTAAGESPESLRADPRRAGVAFARWLNILRGHLQAATRYAEAIRPWQLRFASALPADLALATMDLFAGQPPVAAVKVSRAKVRRLVFRRLLATCLGR